MKNILKLLASFFLVVVFTGVVNAHVKNDTLNVLFIGNSFTHYNDMHEVVKKLG